MCGRYGAFFNNPLGEVVPEMREILDEIAQRYQNTPELAAMKMGEIRPTDMVPVLVWENGATHARLMRWGFPKWQGSGVIFNARSETVIQKPTFRSLMASQRCVIPSTCYFEWQRTGSKAQKDKYRINLRNQSMFYMAGLYNTYSDPLGKPYSAFVILTTEPNDVIVPLHDRMPLVLQDDERDTWLRDYGAAMELLHGKKDTPFELTLEVPGQNDLQGTFL